MNDRPDQFHPQLPTPVMVSNLRILLDRYVPQLVDALLCGFPFGFRIHFQGAEQSFEARNLQSALENPAAVDAKLQKELGAGRLAGSFISPTSFPGFLFYAPAPHLKETLVSAGHVTCRLP